MRPCPSKPELRDFLARSEETAEDDWVSAHLEECSDCRRFVELLVTVLDAPSPSDDPSSPTVLAPLLRYTNDVASPAMRAILLQPLKAIASSAPKKAPLSAPEVMPARIDHYLVRQVVAQGGMGRVFAVTNTITGRELALKHLATEYAQNEDAMRRARKEFKILARLKNEHIVTAVGNGEYLNRPYLVTEFLHGSDLETHIQQHGAMRVQEACRVISEAALGLSHAHDHKVFHRDIKPANLFLDSNGILKVLDFGTAHFHPNPDASSESTGSGYLIGTAHFMAPEQALDVGHADHRADIYSLGCVLGFLLTRQSPFGNLKLHQALAAHQFTDPPSLREQVPEVPHELEALYRRMLAKKCDDRPQSMGEVIAALEPFRS